MTQYLITIPFSEDADRDLRSVQLSRIAAAVGFLSSNRPSKSKLVRWLGDNAALVIALIRATRIDAAKTQDALEEIATATK